jgi:cyclopropane-fatty-acyl-phospholipid synthase
VTDVETRTAAATATAAPAASEAPTGGVATELAPIVERLMGGPPPLLIRCWDGSTMGRAGGPVLHIKSPDALRRMLWAPGELGLGRAYVAGDLDLEGDIFAIFDLRDQLGARHEHVEVGRLGMQGLLDMVKASAKLGILGRPPAPPAEEARLRGRHHTKARDAAAISHHYDVGNDFYRLVLGETMTYSCGYWTERGHDPDPQHLDAAQEAKYDLICRKLALRPGVRLLDVGCGWGGMVLHAAHHYGVEAVGVTLSHEQASLASDRVRDAGLADRVEIRVQDYRDIHDGPFDAISSIGMFEHVGAERMMEYLADLRELLVPRGRLLNHAISRPTPEGKPAISPRSFIGRYVFPDGELLEVGTVVTAMQRLGLEVRDVESLREHYARTLRAWVKDLEDNWDEAVRLVGAPRARIWRLYMAGCAVNFEQNRTAIHQVLAVRTTENGDSGMPPTRDWLAHRA